MNKDIQLFKATFYADLNAIKDLVKCKDDLDIKVAIKEGDYKYYWDNDFISISILDILNWSAFAFYEYIERDSICHKNFNAKNILTINDCINSSAHYYKVMDCIDWICTTFSIKNYQLKDYSRFRALRHLLGQDENWMDEGEMKDALNDGYLKLDLDLINEAEKGNGITCYSLIKIGANYKIDPLDKSEGSTIVDVLDSDLSFQMLHLISFLSAPSSFVISDSYDMLSCIYQVGVSNYILDIILTEH